MLKNRKTIKDLNGKTPEHYAFLGGRIDIYNLISTSDVKEFKEYITSIKNSDKENLNEEIMATLENQNLFLNCFFDNLSKGNISHVKKIIKFYQNNKVLKTNLSLDNFSEKI
jgi:ankyrin repeat protein